MKPRSLRVLFTVQGEGRGHMTQALALQKILLDAGHSICGVMVGRSALREVPAFFLNKIATPVSYFHSPNFVTDARHKSVRAYTTLIHNLSRINVYRQEVRRIHHQVQTVNPDVIVNFLDFLTGLYYRFYKPAIPMVCVGHQYLFFHPEFPLPPGRLIERYAARLYINLTAARAVRRLALSFHPARHPPEKGLVVVPPLLREDVCRQPVETRPYFVVYLLNSGYGEDVVRWHGRNPGVKLHCFWDKKDAPETCVVDETLTFHRLDDQKFLHLLAGSSGLISTAGFESICEAMYLGKPVLMVPVSGHYEQLCNALDAVGAGAGLYDAHFNIDRFVAYLPSHSPDPAAFRAWVARAPEMILREIEAAVPK